MGREQEFKVDVWTTDGIYDRIEIARDKPKDFLPDFYIGASEGPALEGLFSGIDVVASVDLNSWPLLYSIETHLQYRNPEDIFWSKEDIVRLKLRLAESLRACYIISRTHNSGLNYLTIRDDSANCLYALGLGWPDKKSARMGQINLAGQLQRDSKTAEEYERLSQVVRQLVKSDKPLEYINTNTVKISSLLEYNESKQDKLTLVSKERLASEVLGYGNFLEALVNQMSQIKGKPEVGILKIGTMHFQGLSDREIDELL